jgi:hypothetical protein
MHAVVRHFSNENVACLLIGSEVKLEPGSPFGVSVLSHFPLTLTEDFDTSRVNNDVKILSSVSYSDGNRDGLASYTQGCIVGGGTVRTEFFQDV